MFSNEILIFSQYVLFQSNMLQTFQGTCQWGYMANNLTGFFVQTSRNIYLCINILETYQNTQMEHLQNKMTVIQNRRKIKSAIRQTLRPFQIRLSENKCISDHTSQNQGLTNSVATSSLPQNGSGGLKQQQFDEPCFEEDYEIGPMIGMGSQSTVYCCKCKKTGKKYAVKVLKKSCEQSVMGISRTYEMMKKLDHQNIIKVEKLYISKNSKPKIILEYCDFKDLRHYIDEIRKSGKVVPESKIKIIIKSLFRTLDYLKDKRICHRDIKPENILYNQKTDELKLIDFEIGHQNQSEDEEMELWSHSGSLWYRAPETFVGGYDQRVDMWAVGVVLYELLTGNLPFFSEYESKVKKMIKQFSIDFSKVDASAGIINLLIALLNQHPVNHQRWKYFRPHFEKAAYHLEHAFQLMMWKIKQIKSLLGLFQWSPGVQVMNDYLILVYMFKKYDKIKIISPNTSIKSPIAEILKIRIKPSTLIRIDPMFGQQLLRKCLQPYDYW